MEDSEKLKILTQFAQDMAEHDCTYGDNCPTFGSRHGKCIGCLAREALTEAGIEIHHY